MRLEEQRTATQKDQRKRQLRTVGLIVGAVVVVAGGIALFSADDADDASTTDTTASTATTEPIDPTDPVIGTTECPPAEGVDEPVLSFDDGPAACIDVTKAYTATIATSKGDITVELDPEQAARSVNNFVFLARNRFYDGVVFHRIIPGFVVQGGEARGPEGLGYQYADTVPTEGPPFYELGSLVMANSQGPETNSSQFFIVSGQQGVDLPPGYTLFGTVTEGMDVVEEIDATGSESGTPTEETTITSVTITES